MRVQPLLVPEQGAKRQRDLAMLVALVHTIAMIAVGGILAWLVYRYLGLKFLSRSWFNLDATWAGSLILVGSLSLGFSIAAYD